MQTRAELQAALARAMADKATVDLEYRITRFDGETRWVHEQSQASLDPDAAAVVRHLFAGYLVLGLVAGNDTGIRGVAIYMLVYTFMNLGAFYVVVLGVFLFGILRPRKRVEWRSAGMPVETGQRQNATLGSP